MQTETVVVSATLASFGLCRWRNCHMQATVKHGVDTRMSRGIGSAYLLVRS